VPIITKNNATRIGKPEPNFYAKVVFLMFLVKSIKGHRILIPIKFSQQKNDLITCLRAHAMYKSEKIRQVYKYTA
jgi:hypothetical protein